MNTTPADSPLFTRSQGTRGPSSNQGDARRQADALLGEAGQAVARGELVQALGLLDRTLALYRQAGDFAMEAQT